MISGHTTFYLSTVGYEQSEHFLAGTASAYAPTTPLTSDGKWTVAPSSPAPYVTRILVNRPSDKRERAQGATGLDHVRGHRSLRATRASR